MIFVAHFDILVSIEHIPGVANQTADQLSRYNMQTFYVLTYKQNDSL